ncbi:MAG: hypothetical protein WDN46_03635 [Methylocella sp.]
MSRRLRLRLCLGLRFRARAAGDCSAAPASDSAAGGRIASVSERLELTLEDGRQLKIAGIDPPRPTPQDPDLDIKSSEKLADWLNGKEISYRFEGQRPDRWGRFVAEVYAPAGEQGSPLLLVAQASSRRRPCSF